MSTVHDAQGVRRLIEEEFERLGLTLVADDWFVGDGKRHRIGSTYSNGEIRLRLREWSDREMKHQTVLTRDFYTRGLPLEEQTVHTMVQEMVGDLMERVSSAA